MLSEFESELVHVVNAFDPRARDRGKYYDLEWKARDDTKGDEAFRQRSTQLNNP
jgi:hypothetical protein